MESWLNALTSQGTIGVVLCISLYALYRKDREASEERAARIADAQAFNKLAMSLQEQVIEAIANLSKIVEAERLARKERRGLP